MKYNNGSTYWLKLSFGLYRFGVWSDRYGFVGVTSQLQIAGDFLVMGEVKKNPVWLATDAGPPL